MGSEVRDLVKSAPHDRVVEDREKRIADRQRQPYPAHVNAQAAGQSMFKERIAHGMLSAGLISAVLGMQLPGPGSIYLSQTLKFLAPVKFGDTITARAEVIERNAERNRVTLKTTCVNQDGKVVVDGEAVIMPPK